MKSLLTALAFAALTLPLLLYANLAMAFPPNPYFSW